MAGSDQETKKTIGRTGIRELKIKPPRSSQAILDILRKHLEMANNEDLEFLEISYTKRCGEKGSISIATTS